MCMMQSIRRQWERFLESRVGTCCNCHFCSALSLAFTCEASKHSSAGRLQKHQKLLASSAIKLWLIALINSSWIGSARWLMIHDVRSNDCKCGGIPFQIEKPKSKTRPALLHYRVPNCNSHVRKLISSTLINEWLVILSHPASRADLDIWDHLRSSEHLRRKSFAWKTGASGRLRRKKFAKPRFVQTEAVWGCLQSNSKPVDLARWECFGPLYWSWMLFILMTIVSHLVP